MAASLKLGTAGVAPKVTLVNIRAGHDSGFFFLQPTVDAMVYARAAVRTRRRIPSPPTPSGSRPCLGAGLPWPP